MTVRPKVKTAERSEFEQLADSGYLREPLATELETIFRISPTMRFRS